MKLLLKRREHFSPYISAEISFNPRTMDQAFSYFFFFSRRYNFIY